MTAGILIVLALMAMVLLHELGHFLAARAVGIRASKFYVFFPPAIFKVKKGDVEYGLGSIPLGGFVSFPGMFQPVPRDVHWRFEPMAEDLAAATPEAEDREAFRDAYAAIGSASSPEQLAARLQSAADVLERLAGKHEGDDAPEPAGMRRAEYLGLARRLHKRVAASVDDCHPKAHWRAALWRRMTVILAGPVVNIVCGLALLTALAYTATAVTTVRELTILSVPKDMPAYEAGMRSGDEVVEWRGRSVDGTSREELGDILLPGTTRAYDVVVRRDGELRTFTLTPRDVRGDGSSRPRVGVQGFEVDGPRERFRTLPESMRWSVGVLGDVVTGTGAIFARIADPEARRQVSSVVGVVQDADEAERRIGLVTYMALISLTLGVFNLLPLLPLDGGHLLFGFVEFLRRGRPLPRTAFERYSIVGLALVMGLFFIGLSNDLGLSG